MRRLRITLRTSARGPRGQERGRTRTWPGRQPAGPPARPLAPADCLYPGFEPPRSSVRAHWQAPAEQTPIMFPVKAFQVKAFQVKSFEVKASESIAAWQPPGARPYLPPLSPSARAAPACRRQPPAPRALASANTHRAHQHRAHRAHRHPAHRRVHID